MAAGIVGLWLGERGRRIAAERHEATGLATGAQASRLADQPDAEQRVMGAGHHLAEKRFSEDTIRKGIEQLQAEAGALGRPISVEAAREQAIAMLYGAVQSDSDLPEFS